MPQPDRLLLTIQKAVRACRETPGRAGRVVRIAPGDEVLIAGDLHGHLGNFRRLLELADLGRHPRRHLVLQELIHGPFRYDAGGEKSHQLVDLFCALKCQYPGRAHYLLGNHELSQSTGRAIGKADDDLNELFWWGVHSAYGDWAEPIYLAYNELFAALPVALRTANRLYFSHSLPAGPHLERFDPTALEAGPGAEEDVRPGGSVHSLVWGRDTRAEHVAEFLRRVDADLLVSGHIATPAGLAVPNAQQIILDSMDSPAAYLLAPTDRPLTQADLIASVRWL